jgi:hypothetical protein
MLTARSTLELKPRFSREDLRDLVEAGDGWRLSLFMPLARTGRDVHKAPILLKDLRARAAQELEERRAPPEDSEEILAAVDRILQEAETTVIQGEGLAVFASSRQAYSYLLPVRPDALVSVDRRFRLEPIVPLLFEDGHFYLLTLSLNEVRLFGGDRTGLAEISLEGMATNLREAIRFEDSDSYLNLHTSVGTPGLGRGPAMYHGHGSGKGDMREMKKDIARFFQQLDDGLRPRMDDPARPLLLAGAEPLLPIFRASSSHPRILDVSLPAHLDKLAGLNELHERAWALFEREAKADRRALLHRYNERLATGDTAAGITDVAPLADQGRVSHLFVREGYQAFGAYEAASGKVFGSPVRQPGDEDLVSLAAVRTIMGGGKVYVLRDGEIPGGADIAALCRY